MSNPLSATSDTVLFAANGLTITPAFIQKGTYHYRTADITSVQLATMPAQRGAGITFLVISLVIFSCTCGANALLNSLLTGNSSGSLPGQSTGFAIFPVFLLTIFLAFIPAIAGLIMLLRARQRFAVEVSGASVAPERRVLIVSPDKSAVEPVYHAVLAALNQRPQ